MKKRRWGLLILVAVLLIIFLIRRVGIAPPHPKISPIEKEIYEKPPVETPLEEVKEIPKPIPSKKRIEKRVTPPQTDSSTISEAPRTIDTLRLELQVVTSAPEVAERVMEPEERGELELRIGESSEGIKRERLGGTLYPILDAKPILLRAARPPVILKNQAIVRALVEMDGAIIKTEIEKSAGNSYTDSLLLSTVKEFRFSPGFYKGNPTRVEILIPFEP